MCPACFAGAVVVSCHSAPAICNRACICRCSDEEDTSKGIAPDETVDLPPEKRGPVAASSSQDERDAYSSTDDMVLQSAEDLRERRSRCRVVSLKGWHFVHMCRYSKSIHDHTPCSALRDVLTANG